jgi:hypothetical protein
MFQQATFQPVWMFICGVQECAASVWLKVLLLLELKPFGIDIAAKQLVCV